MQISELFWLTHTSPYTTIGDGVDYSFKEDGKTLYILFQGSSQKVDWIQNFNFPKRPYKDMEIPYKVHGGFLKCWKQVEDIIINKIKEIDDSGNFKFNCIIISGYSHGGALAAFCHECVWYHRPDIRTNCWSYGFEAPRIYGGFKVKEELRERWAHYILIRNHTDLVTHVPPHILGFCDLGTVLHIGRFQNYRDIKVKPNLDCIKSHFPEMVYTSLKEINFDISKGE